ERAQQKETELNEKYNKIRSKIDSHRQSRQNIKTSIEKNRETRNKLTSEFNSLGVSEADITVLEKLQIIENKVSSLDDEISRLHHQSNSCAKLDLQKSNLRTKTESLNTFLASSRNDFKNAL
ncbi:21894_t:CDS:2, partial [Dentiscutata erythropus]